MSLQTLMAVATPWPDHRRLPRFTVERIDYTPPPLPLVQVLTRIAGADAAFLQQLKPAVAEEMGEWAQCFIDQAWEATGAAEGRRIEAVATRISPAHQFWSDSLGSDCLRGSKLTPLHLVIPEETWERLLILAEAWSFKPESLLRACVVTRIRQLRKFFATSPAEWETWRKEDT